MRRYSAFLVLTLSILFLMRPAAAAAQTTPAGQALTAPVVGQKHVAAMVNQANNVELRVWNLDTGKLVESRRSESGYGYLTVYAGALMLVSQRESSVEKLKAAAPAAPVVPATPTAPTAPAPRAEGK